MSMLKVVLVVSLFAIVFGDFVVHETVGGCKLIERNIEEMQEVMEASCTFHSGHVATGYGTVRMANQCMAKTGESSGDPPLLRPFIENEGIAFSAAWLRTR